MPDQISGPLDRIVIAAVLYLLGRLHFDAVISTDIAALVVTGLGALYGWWVNRPRAIQQSSVALPNTMVVELSPNHSATAVAGALANVPGVTTVMVDGAELANTVPSAKVVAA